MNGGEEKIHFIDFYIKLCITFSQKLCYYPDTKEIIFSNVWNVF